jgi:hypothetical protein
MTYTGHLTKRENNIQGRPVTPSLTIHSIVKSLTLSKL